MLWKPGTSQTKVKYHWSFGEEELLMKAMNIGIFKNR